MNEYRNEIGHIIGTTGKLIHHIGNILSITANHLTTDNETTEPQPQGDTYTNTELDARQEPTEMHADYRPPAEYSISLRSTK